MVISRKPKRILDGYQFPFFRPLEKMRGIFGDFKARIITLVRPIGCDAQSDVMVKSVPVPFFVVA